MYLNIYITYIDVYLLFFVDKDPVVRVRQRSKCTGDQVTILVDGIPSPDPIPYIIVLSTLQSAGKLKTENRILLKRIGEKSTITITFYSQNTSREPRQVPQMEVVQSSTYEFCNIGRRIVDRLSSLYILKFFYVQQCTTKTNYRVLLSPHVTMKEDSCFCNGLGPYRG